MSTKYNRNDSNAGDDKFYLNDFKAELNGVEQDDREQSKDFELLPCIVSGLGLTPAAYPSTNVTVAPGSARDKDGRRIQIASSQIVQITDTGGGSNYVILSHKYSEDTPRKAFTTGTEYNTRKYDDFELTVASTYSSDDIVLGNVKVEGSENVLYTDERTPDVAKPVRKESPPPVPIHLDIETGWDDAFRKTGESAGLVSFRPAYIKAEFGDRGNGTASGITFTKTDNRIGDWTTNEWIGYCLTCADGNSWRVESNTIDTLTLATGAVPVTGIFHLGPNAAGYKWVIQTLDPDTEAVQATREGESQYMESPVKMDRIFHSLMPDIKYRIKVASKGGWFQEEWSEFSVAAEKIAGGAKEIPDACGDTLDGDPTITAEDDGIRISWSVKALYQDKVAGFELCWTDDGLTTPDFGNKNHRKTFTDRNFVVLPAKLSSDDTTVKIKAKMRAIDKAGRHCVTPKTLDDTDAKKYPADLSTLVTDYKNILSPGGFGTLKEMLQQSINLASGRSKMVSEVESEMADARGTYATVGSRIAAILQGELDWGYVRLVAKTGGQYTSIQAAIDSISTNDFHVILIMPGLYTENIEVDSQKDVGFTGIGDVRIDGILGTKAGDAGYVSFIDNLYINGKVDISVVKFATAAYFRNLRVKSTTGDAATITIVGAIDVVKLILRDCYFKSTSGKGVVFDTQSQDELYAEIKGCVVDSNEQCLYVDCGATPVAIILRVWDSMLKVGAGAANCIGAAVANPNPDLFMSDCQYNKVPDAANLDCDYGAVSNVTNAIFDDADLASLI